MSATRRPRWSARFATRGVLDPRAFSRAVVLLLFSQCSFSFRSMTSYIDAAIDRRAELGKHGPITEFVERAQAHRRGQRTG